MMEENYILIKIIKVRVHILIIPFQTNNGINYRFTRFSRRGKPRCIKNEIKKNQWLKGCWDASVVSWEIVYKRWNQVLYVTTHNDHMEIPEETHHSPFLPRNFCSAEILVRRWFELFKEIKSVDGTFGKVSTDKLCGTKHGKV